MRNQLKFRTYIPDLKFFKYWGWLDEGHYVSMCACGDFSRTELLEKYTNQCCGYKDVNKNLIFEGDIVEDVASSLIYEVGFKKGAFYLKNKEFIEYFHELSLAHTERRLEVIGNIYESPELIKGLK